MCKILLLAALSFSIAACGGEDPVNPCGSAMPTTVQSAADGEGDTNADQAGMDVDAVGGSSEESASGVDNGTMDQGELTAGEMGGGAEAQ